MIAKVFAIVVAALAFAMATLRADPPTTFLSACEIPGLKDKAKCGTFEVWENRDARTGRRIGLKVVVLPATGSPRETDAFALLGGGPGEAITDAAAGAAAEFAAIRQHRDILLVDQRGTGGSHALGCDLYPSADPQAALGAFFPPARVRECRSRLEKTADLRMYTTAAAVDDLDEDRAALGYDRLNLFGGSYGTRASLAFMRRHPQHVRTAVLQGVAPASDLMPLHFPEHAQHAIEAVFADCRADADCRAAFPDSAAELRKIVARTAAAPVPVDILDPTTGDTAHVQLSRNLLGEALRYLMYQSGTALFVPLLVHQAAQGDFAPLAEFALSSRRNVVNSLGQGLYLSVTCSEDLPFIAAPEAERAAANTFLGDYRYQQQRAACDAWARGPVPAGHASPVRADTPTLLLSGSWDPVTPASNAQQAASTLPHSLSIVVSAGGHGYGGLPGADACLSKIVTQFIERGSTDGLDVACVASLHRRPFPTKPLETTPVTLSPDQLAALVGHYVAEGAPPLEIALDRGRLVSRVEGEEQRTALAPVSPTRLRLLGDVGSYLTVVMQSGKAAQLTLERSGTAVITWKRAE